MVRITDAAQERFGKILARLRALEAYQATAALTPEDRRDVSELIVYWKQYAASVLWQLQRSPGPYRP